MSDLRDLVTFSAPAGWSERSLVVYQMPWPSPRRMPPVVCVGSEPRLAMLDLPTAVARRLTEAKIAPLTERHLEINGARAYEVTYTCTTPRGTLMFRDVYFDVRAPEGPQLLWFSSSCIAEDATVAVPYFETILRSMKLANAAPIDAPGAASSEASAEPPHRSGVASAPDDAGAEWKVHDDLWPIPGTGARR